LKSKKTKKFKKAFDKLPDSIKVKAFENFRLWKENPYHPSLNFKKITKDNVYSIRIGISYRALGIYQPNVLIWFWIGSHEDYNNLIK
jgi:mRNA-degrading endonuclease RelE of RelBE toxin-antitoxin system